MSDDRGPARGSVVLYLLGFGALIVAGALVGYAAAVDVFEHLGLLWISVGASVAAAALALLSLVWNRRA